ncbi:MAG: chemoreceptor glutamine deamidase CheD [Hyphomicrobiales bacterium]|nr:chemoreceptor glutamine deamidase CheD [Hyphomicrobiales bacterium]
MRNFPIRRTDTEKTQVGDYYDGVGRYYDQIHEISVVKLFSGDCYVTADRGEMLVTILGSCIAACVRDPVAGVGGMNHFLLPGDTAGGKVLDESTRYGAFAMEQLINSIMKLGGKKERLEVKIFGGGNVIQNTSMIGDKNIAFVRQFLKDEGLKAVSEDVGGTFPRRVHYYPDTGKVMVRKLTRKNDMIVVDKEREYQQSLRESDTKKAGAKNVELF